LTCTPHERLALGVLVGARRLTHKHEFRLGVSNAEDDLRPSLGEVRALDANKRGFAQGLEGRVCRGFLTPDR
jgi:hypothetical protein